MKETTTSRYLHSNRIFGKHNFLFSNGVKDRVFLWKFPFAELVRVCVCCGTCAGVYICRHRPTHTHIYFLPFSMLTMFGYVSDFFFRFYDDCLSVWIMMCYRNGHNKITTTRVPILINIFCCCRFFVKLLSHWLFIYYITVWH